MAEPITADLLLEGRRTRGEGEAIRKFRYNVGTKRIEYYSESLHSWQPYTGTARVIQVEKGDDPTYALVRDEEGNVVNIPTSNVPDAEIWEPVPAEEPGKGYSTKAQAKAQALPGETQIQLPDGTWDNVKAPDLTKGYDSRDEAIAQARQGDIVRERPDGSWEIVPLGSAPKDTHWQQIGEDPYSPKSWWPVRDGYELQMQEGPGGELEWVEVAAARTDIVQRPQQAPGQGMEWVWDGNQWVEKPVAAKAPSGWFATQEEAAAHAARIGRSDLVPQYDPKTGGFTLGEKPKVTPQDLLNQAIADDDWDAAVRINDLMNLPTAQERLSLALQYARSPADYQTVLGIMRGELPPQATGGAFPSAADTLSLAMYGKGALPVPQAVPGGKPPVTPGLTPGGQTLFNEEGVPRYFGPGEVIPPGYTKNAPGVGPGGPRGPGAFPTTGQRQYRMRARDTGEEFTVPEDQVRDYVQEGFEYLGPATEAAVTTGPQAPPGILTIPGAATTTTPTTTGALTTGALPTGVTPPTMFSSPTGVRTPTRYISDTGLTPAQRDAWIKMYGSTPEQYLAQAGREAFQTRLRALFPSGGISLVPPEARTGAVVRQRALLPETNPDIPGFPSAQGWSRWSVPERQAFVGRLQELRISGPWLEEYERQMRASTLPAGGRRSPIYSAARMIPTGAIR